MIAAATDAPAPDSTAITPSHRTGEGAAAMVGAVCLPVLSALLGSDVIKANPWLVAVILGSAAAVCITFILCRTWLKVRALPGAR